MNSTRGELSVKHGLYHTRVTESQDFTTDIGLKHAVDKVTSAKPATLLWVSMPCTGGSAWQRINLSTGADSTRDRIMAHQRTFDKL